MKYRFYINEVLVHEPKNWNSDKITLSRSKQYYGTQVGASYDEVIFAKIVSRTIPNGYDILKSIFETNGINSKATLRVDVYDEDLGNFTNLDNFDIDFTEYKEMYDVENGKAVSVQLVSSNIWRSINDRGNLDLLIGNSESIENETIIAVNSVDVLIQGLPLELRGIYEKGYYVIDYLFINSLVFVSQFASGGNWLITWRITTEQPHNLNPAMYVNVKGVGNASFAATYGINIEQYVNSVIDAYSFEFTVLNGTPYNPPDAAIITYTISRVEVYSSIFVNAITETSNAITDNAIKMLPANKIVSSSEVATSQLFANISLDAGIFHNGGGLVGYFNDIKLFDKMTFDNIILGVSKKDIEVTATIDIELDTYYFVAAGGLNLVVVEMEYNITTGFFEQQNILQSYPITLEYNANYESKTINYNNTITINKGKNKLIAIGLNRNATFDGTIVILGYTKVNIELKYFDIEDDSTHKAYSLKDCFTSLTRQLTGNNSILNAPILETYPYNAVYLTNGELLRNAETIDGIKPDLKLSFQKLFSTINKWTPIGMIIEDDQIKIVERNDIYGTNEVELEVRELEISVMNELYYNSVKVGNTRIQYEEKNGTEEFNTVLDFVNDMRCKENTLNLVTEYNTDYLAVELARRLSFATNLQEDTKYDDKIMLIICENVGGNIRTKKFTDFSNYVFPNFIFNLPFSSKRMLLNNSAEIKASMYLSSGKLRFEKIENQSNLISKLPEESANVIERANVELNEMLEPKYLPIIYKAEIGQREFYKTLKNVENFYTFVFKGKRYSGYLFGTEMSDNIANITLLAKNENF